MLFAVFTRPFWNLTISDLKVSSTNQATHTNLDSSEKSDAGTSSKSVLLLKTKVKYLSPKDYNLGSNNLILEDLDISNSSGYIQEPKQRLISLRGLSPPSVNKSHPHLFTKGDFNFAFRSFSISSRVITI